MTHHRKTMQPDRPSSIYRRHVAASVAEKLCGVRWAAVLIVIAMIGPVPLTGCNQPRYQPAEWRAAPRPSSSVAPDGTSLPDASRFGNLTPWTDPNLPSGADAGRFRGPADTLNASWGTLPNGVGTTLPMRNFSGGTTLPYRAGTTLPYEAGSTLPPRGYRSGTTLPQIPGTTLPLREFRRGIPSFDRPGSTLPLPNRNQSSLPLRNFPNNPISSGTTLP